MPWLEPQLACSWLDRCQAMTASAVGALGELAADAAAAGVRPTLHWERAGSGPAALLITGLGLSSGAWWRTIPVLADRLEVITFDNRGVGRSSAPLHAYSTAMMADDAVSVLDRAGVERAHVYGISLGGMVAQQVALRHPERVSSLVLGATYAGGPHARRPARAILDFLTRRLWMDHEEAARRSLPYNYSARCLAEYPERVAEDIAQRLAQRFSVEAYWAQLWAGATHDTSGRLSQITAPTLVVHGDADRLIPVENGRMLASRIRGAQLRELAGCGHLYATEVPEVDREIADFMARH